jgi:hypothetical protein
MSIGVYRGTLARVILYFKMKGGMTEEKSCRLVMIVPYEIKLSGEDEELTKMSGARTSKRRRRGIAV